ncbi:DUF5063 domain-containing protein [Nocardioides marmoribigeumensis]|jgi:hypothetical protein|uniref:DUF5063 domain-containing protein n=1 Tax=Nocardioides marmoribigeumensis TaxID=433649 RepID=A0ABU2BU73_9ACTN|nr:DUF5063 domain-containing protein [Nocardioides marmoribigeumensis]MDR7362180.1 hypothetical protein [Nocardioides marmoribigeumensis]
MGDNLMTEEGRAPLDEELVDFAQTIADQVESFLIAVQAVSRGEEGGSAVPLMLLETSQLLLAGARLGMQVDFELQEEYEPDAGPDPDLDAMRHRLGVLFEDFDAFTVVFDPYAETPEVVPTLLSDELTSIATAIAHGLRHYRSGRVTEALWWWQLSYHVSWGSEAIAVLRALQAVVAHDRLDTDLGSDDDAVIEALEILERD